MTVCYWHRRNTLTYSLTYLRTYLLTYSSKHVCDLRAIVFSLMFSWTFVRSEIAENVKCSCFRADPFTRVVFLNHSQATESLRKTICPTWDQTLVFDTVEIHGDPQSVAANPPKIVVEIFDFDSFVSSTSRNCFFKFCNELCNQQKKIVSQCDSHRHKYVCIHYCAKLQFIG